MAYQVLARKWRPQTFAEVIGQEHITRALKNAILQNRIGQAYLFVGSRGIGKTTTARIFAKALNCLNPLPDGEPCCQCENCRQIVAGSSLDVVEIDGASHNKVEDIRIIRDNVQYAPTGGKYKIYIIDEVHMLTTQAWNALLKTLEEPPPHVKFLFATTEPHKVLPTILSRCQRFDMRRISVSQIVTRLRQIAEGEKIFIEDAALIAIARAADGGMRDAQSIMDQMIAFCGGMKAEECITERDVMQVFGIASGSELRKIAGAIFEKDMDGALQVVQSLADAGRDLERLYGDLIEYVRNLMIAGQCRNPEILVDASESDWADWKQIAAAVPPAKVQIALQQLISQESQFRLALDKRIYLEAVLARVMLEVHAVRLDDILTHLNRLSGLLPADAVPPVSSAVQIPPSVTEKNVVAASAAESAPVPPETKQEPEEVVCEELFSPESLLANAVAAKMNARPVVSAVPEAIKPAESSQPEPSDVPVPVIAQAPAETSVPVETPVPVEAPATEETPVPVETSVSVETPVPAEAPVPVVVEAPAAVAESPAAVAESPAAAVESPAAVAESPAVVEESPAAVEESPAAVEESPAAAVEDAPAAVEDAPAVVEDAPAVVEDAPAVVEDAPAAVEDAPAAVEEAPAEDLAREETLPVAGSLDVLDCSEEGEEYMPTESVQEAMVLPEEAASRLITGLMEIHQDNLVKLLENFRPVSYSQKELVLSYSSSQVNQDQRLLLDAVSTRAICSQCMYHAGLAGQIRFQEEAAEGESSERGGVLVKYRMANYLENQRIQKNPFVQQLSEALNMQMVDARIPVETARQD